MKYLIFGDVHGNLPALEKLLEIEKNNYDCIISHGDVINYGPWSNECVEFLSTIPGLITLKGNHEAIFLKGRYSGKNEIANAFFDFCYPRFSKFEEIKKYRYQHKLKNYMIQHTINNSYVFPDTDLGSLKLRNNYIIGHSHYQFHRKFKGKEVINTGSLGQNRKYINNSEYIILDETKNVIELKSYKCDIKKVIDKMTSVNYPSVCLDYYKNKHKL